MRRFLHGAAQPLPSALEGRHAVYDGSELVGVGTLHEGILRPDKVLTR